MRESDTADPPLARATNKVLGYAEDAVYAIVALILLVAALLLVGDTVVQFGSVLGEGVEEAIKLGLDRLLLVFILIELLGAVRVTLRSRQLVAEPFLLVGIIASIKEIVVIAVESKEQMSRAEFQDAMTEIAVLGVLVLILGATSLLLRRKEREPEEDS